MEKKNYLQPYVQQMHWKKQSSTSVDANSSMLTTKQVASSPSLHVDLTRIISVADGPP